MANKPLQLGGSGLSRPMLAHGPRQPGPQLSGRALYLRKRKVASVSNSQRDHDHDSHLREALLSSSNQFDHAVLTLSSGLLALSLAFIKDIVPLKDAQWMNLLFVSWCLLGFAILSTVISFLASQKAIRNCLEESGSDGGAWSKTTTWINISSAAFFVVGVSSTVIFVIKNLCKEGG